MVTLEGELDFRRVRSPLSVNLYQPVLFTTDDEYRWVLESGVISPPAVGDLYPVDPERVRIFELASLHVIKVSFPRNVVAGSFDDRDLHAGQQHVLLGGLTVPLRPAPPGAAIIEGSTMK
jgi:Domain of unknown function (DUF4387)